MIKFLLDNYTLIILIIGFVFLINSQFKIGNKDLSMFKDIIILIAILIVSNILEDYFANLDHLTIYRYIFSVISYSIKPFLLYRYICIINDNGRIFTKLSIPAFINLGIYFTAFFSNIAFSFSETNHFLRGPLGYTVHLVSIFYIIILIYSIFKKFKRLKKNEFIYLMSIIFFFIMAFVLETLDIKSGILDYSILICTIFYYIFNYIYYSKRDVLTSLFNRQDFYEDIINYDKKIAAVMSIDMNGLKRINDNYGHNEGDKAIIKISDVFHEVKNNNYLFYRIGGDEFCALCLMQDEINIKKMIKRINKLLSKTPYTCSIGYAMRKDNENVLDTYKIADDEMYKQKTKHYKSLVA